jgi:ATP-dependent RNA helicase DeaD
MEQFREGHINILVATDLAARGIDVKISYVVITIYDVYEAYNARRTARAGTKGLLTVLQPEEVAEMPTLKELGYNLPNSKKPTVASIEENNTLLWANKYSKTNPTTK